MARFRKDGVMNHIDGQNAPAMSGETFTTISPIDLSELAPVARGASRGRAARAAVVEARTARSAFIHVRNT